MSTVDRRFRSDVMHCCRAAAALLLLTAPLMASAFEGPLQVRNQFPMFLPAAQPYLESAAMRDLIMVDLHYSSVYVTETSPGWQVMMDLEMTELSLRFRKRIGGRRELGLDVPLFRQTEGFLDEPLACFHDALGTGDYGRHARPMNEFLYEVSRGGAPVIRGVNHRAGLGDVRMTYKELLREASPRVSVRVDIDAPTGDARTGYGNGSWDAGLALLADADLSDVYQMTVNVGAAVPGDLKGYQRVPLRTFGYAGAGIEAAWWKQLHALVQVVVQTSPYPSTGIRQVDWPGVLLTFGARYSFERTSFELSLTEDPDTAGAPDFIMNATAILRF